MAAVVEVARRISYQPWEESGFPSRFPGILEVHLKDGRTLTASVEDVKGSPRRPLSAAELQTKFEANAKRRLKADAVARVPELVDELDRADTLGPLSEALRSVLE